MIRFDEDMTIAVSMEPIDMRAGIDKLIAQILEAFQMDIRTKTLFVFCNKKKNKVKGIYWDKNGFMLLHKRLERGKFQFPGVYKHKQLLLTREQLYGLLAGFDFVRMEEYPELDFSYYF
jgi:transposase